jgi:L-alanine-DL-glutamate epimerase-like enolase superfamily enzyme
MGGISEVSKIIAMASAEGMPVSPHVFPEVHIHLAAAFGNVKTVELTDPERGYEGLHRLFSTWIHIDGGDVVAPVVPGIGVEIDWGAVDAHRRS